VASLEDLARIAEIEFTDIVDSTDIIGMKLRVMLGEGGFVDVWLSRKLQNKFGFHWEEEGTGLCYRYDNFPNTKWKYVPTYPYHFHSGSRDNVSDSSRFSKDVLKGFRDFMEWVRLKSGSERKDSW